MGLAIAALLEEAKTAGELRVFGRRPAAPAHPLFQGARVSHEHRWSGPPGPGTVVILAVPDDSIAAVAESLAGLGKPGPGAAGLHLSGARPSRILEPLARVGYAVGSLHPLQAVASREEGAAKLRGSYFAFEGEPGAREAAVAVVRAAQGSLLELEAGSKELYHAACVFASNYLVTNAAVAARILAKAAFVTR